MSLHKPVRVAQTFALSDGRRLGYAEYGVPDGTPVLFFRGSPGSGYIHADVADMAARHGIRLIAVGRPGYGWSDPQPGRTMLNWSDDIAALTDALGIARFAIYNNAETTSKIIQLLTKCCHLFCGLTLAL